MQSTEGKFRLWVCTCLGVLVRTENWHVASFTAKFELTVHCLCQQERTTLHWIKQEQPVIFLTGHFAPEQTRTKRFSYAGLERHVINVLVIQPPNDSFGWFPGGMIVQHTSLNDFNLLRPEHFHSMHL